MTFGTPETISSYPKEVSLGTSDGENIDLGVYGIHDIISVDSLLLVVTTQDKDIVSLYDRVTLNHRGSFLRVGNGPGELQMFSFPSRYGNRFYSKDGYIYVDFVNGMKNVLRWNVSEAYDNGKEQIEEIPVDASSMSMFRWLINDSTIVFKTLADANTRQVRTVMVNGEDRTPPFLSELNDARIETENDGRLFNLLSSLVTYDPFSGIVAESSLYLDIINLYSLRDGFHRSIRIGNRKPVSISDLESIMKAKNEPSQTIWYSMGGKDFFAVLYGADSSSRNSILVFGWDGTPKCRINFEENISAFDINGNTLITLSRDTESVRRYTI